MANGEAPHDLWGLSEVACGIIARQRQQEERMQTLLAEPELVAAVEQVKQRQQAEVTRSEQAWRDGPGRGAGGRRHTGD